MPAALEAVDIVTLLAVFLLIGMLLAVRNTFSLLAVALDVSIVGLHPFRFLSTALESTIIRGCNAGINALNDVAHAMIEGLVWSFTWMVNAIKTGLNYTGEALDYLRNTAIHAVIKAYLAPINKAISDIENGTKAATGELAKEITRIDATIDTKVGAAVTTLERKLGTAVKTVEGDITSQVDSLRKAVDTEIRSMVTTAEAKGSAAVTALGKAESAAIGAIGEAEDATAQKLRDLIHSLPLTDIASVAAAVPLIAAAVQVLEAETGLSNEQCRSKVKNICSTDPNIWAQILGSLVAIGLTFSLKDIVELIVKFGEANAGLIEGMANSVG